MTRIPVTDLARNPADIMSRVAYGGARDELGSTPKGQAVAGGNDLGVHEALEHLLVAGLTEDDGHEGGGVDDHTPSGP